MLMTSSVHTNLSLSFLRIRNPATSSPATHRRISINCGGPRSNRGPLVKGRILSIEAIHAIQALKRAHRIDPTSLPSHSTTILPRLLKSDLLSTFKELLRQNQFQIALTVFQAIRSEYTPDLDLYALLVNGLNTNGLTQGIDKLVCDMEEDGQFDCQDKGLIKLVKALVEAQRRESTVRLYGLLKKSGWEVDEYVAQVLSKGLRTMGEQILADEIDEELNRLFRTNLAKPVV